MIVPQAANGTIHPSGGHSVRFVQLTSPASEERGPMSRGAGLRLERNWREAGREGAGERGSRGQREPVFQGVILAALPFGCCRTVSVWGGGRASKGPRIRRVRTLGRQRPPAGELGAGLPASSSPHGSHVASADGSGCSEGQSATVWGPGTVCC